MSLAERNRVERIVNAIVKVERFSGWKDFIPGQKLVQKARPGTRDRYCIARISA